MDNEPCGCEGSAETSSLEDDFVPEGVTNIVGHKMTAQESAEMAYGQTLGLKRKSELTDGEYQ